MSSTSQYICYCNSPRIVLNYNPLHHCDYCIGRMNMDWMKNHPDPSEQLRDSILNNINILMKEGRIDLLKNIQSVIEAFDPKQNERKERVD